MQTKDLEAILFEFSPAPMNAVQIHGFFCGVLCAPGDPEPMVWAEELLRADAEREVPEHAFRSEEGLKRILYGIMESYNEIAEVITTEEFRPPFRVEQPNADDRYQASRWAEAFWRGFVIGDGDRFVQEDEDVRQAMIIPLIIRDPKDALSEIEFEEEPSAGEITEFVTQQLGQLPQVVRLVASHARARHLQDFQQRRGGNGHTDANGHTDGADGYGGSHVTDE